MIIQDMLLQVMLLASTHAVPAIIIISLTTTPTGNNHADIHTRQVCHTVVMDSRRGRMHQSHTPTIARAPRRHTRQHQGPRVLLLVVVTKYYDRSSMQCSKGREGEKRQ